MIESDYISISEIPFKALVIVGALLVLNYLILKFLKRYLFMMVKSEIWHQRIENSWVRIELGIWLLVSVMLLVYMLNQGFLITVVILLVAFVVGGRYWRDIVSGIVVKFEQKIAEGDFLSNPEYAGVVVDLGIRGVQIRLDGGDVAYISYRSLGDFRVRKLERDLKSELCSVTVNFKPEVSVEKAIQILSREAMLIPYTLLTESAKVEVVELTEEGATLRVLVHTHSLESAKLLELALKVALKSQNSLHE
jgi:small-conductance mechanosensitive channel